MNEDKIRSLYLHVPFCAGICFYCDFFRQIYNEKLADQWLDAIAFELSHSDINPHLDTIYIGGGTPSCLSESQLERLLTMLDPYKNEIAEFTVELNAETVTSAKLNRFVMHGVNRFSIGLQSCDSALLAQMNRRHSFADVERLVNQIFACGISNISLDLMYSLPHQTMEQLQESTRLALSLNPAHLSLYSLTIEENSVFGKQGVTPLDEDTEADMYEWLCRYLKEQGYEHYEISNFARPSKQSLHNVRIWQYEDFYGIGAGAMGKDPDGRYEHPGKLKDYLKDPTRRLYTHLSKLERMFETVMMGLRLSAGISRKTFRDTYGIELAAAYPHTIDALSSQGLLEISDDFMRCTEQGMELLNTVLVAFMEEAQL